MNSKAYWHHISKNGPTKTEKIMQTDKGGDYFAKKIMLEAVANMKYEDEEKELDRLETVKNLREDINGLLDNALNNALLWEE